MQIAELEQRTGVNRHTLRYYEKAGLLQDCLLYTSPSPRDRG